MARRVSAASRRRRDHPLDAATMRAGDGAIKDALRQQFSADTARRCPRTLPDADPRALIRPVGGDGMKSSAFRAASMVAVYGTTLLATMAFALPFGMPFFLPFFLGTAAAADLPIKAPPKAPDTTGQFWIGVDYLAWSVKGDHLPALVTTSPAGTPLLQAGVLGAPLTTVLFGNSTVNGGWRSGGRLQAGYWFDPQRSRGVEVELLRPAGRTRPALPPSSNAHRHPRAAVHRRDDQSAERGAGRLSRALLTGAIAVNETSRLLGAGALYRQDLGDVGRRAHQRADRLSLSAFVRRLSIPVAAATLPASSRSATPTHSTPSAISTASTSGLPANGAAVRGCWNGAARWRSAPTSTAPRSTASTTVTALGTTQTFRADC